MKIKAVLFDKDGTLLDFQASWGGWAADVVQELACGKAERASQLAQVLGLDLNARRVLPGSVIIAGTAQDICEVIARVPGMGTVEALTRRIIDLSMQVTPQPICPLQPFLADLCSRGLRLGVATNDAEEPTLGQLRVLGISEHFEFVAGYDSGHGAKPGPGPCLAFARHLGLEPENCAMVGDSLHDLLAGEAAGMVRIAVESGLASADSLAAHADVVLPDVTHIGPWFDQAPR